MSLPADVRAAVREQFKRLLADEPLKAAIEVHMNQRRDRAVSAMRTAVVQRDFQLAAMLEAEAATCEGFLADIAREAKNS